MERHYRTLEKVRHKILELPNVRGVGVGYKRVGMSRTDKPAIVVFVEKKYPAGDLHRDHLVPGKIKGMSTDVIEIGKVRLLERPQKVRPAVPGSSIGHYKITAGTFGAVVKDQKTGDRLILSNNHILANGTDGKDGRASIGDPILQPGPYDGGKKDHDRVAELYRFIPLVREYEQPECPVASKAAAIGNSIIKIIRPSYELRLYKNTRFSNVVDCAVAKPVSPGIIDDRIIEIGRVSGVKEISEGMQVQKSGRSSGLTKGEITARGVTLKVDLSEEETGWFSDQIVSDLLCQPGDSGSLILDQDNNAVGLLFAGSDTYCIFNRIQNVMDALQVEF